MIAVHIFSSTRNLWQVADEQIIIHSLFYLNISVEIPSLTLVCQKEATLKFLLSASVLHNPVQHEVREVGSLKDEMGLCGVRELLVF